MTKQLSLKDLIHSYGIKNLVFVLSIECFCDDALKITAQFGFGLTDSKNTKRVQMKIDHSRFDINSSSKVVLISEEYDIGTPAQSYHVGHFDWLLSEQEISVYAKTPDGLNPISVGFKDIISPQDKECIEFVESNFFLLQPFIHPTDTLQ
jgi:hypothetical protein